MPISLVILIPLLGVSVAVTRLLFQKRILPTYVHTSKHFKKYRKSMLQCMNFAEVVCHDKLDRMYSSSTLSSCFFLLIKVLMAKKKKN